LIDFFVHDVEVGYRVTASDLLVSANNVSAGSRTTLVDNATVAISFVLTREFKCDEGSAGQAGNKA
jgi:hypothetical protein